MHPNGAFDWTDRKEILNFVQREGFAHIFTASDNDLSVVHAPLLVRDSGQIQFHVSRRNRAAGRIADRRALISIVGRHAYQSANWYVSANQVPTWHYEAVEIEGVARELSPDELVAQLDGLSEIYEPRVEPDQPWTRGKMDPAKFAAMARAIVGFEVEPTEVRGTRKFNQHKPGPDLDATIEGQRAAGREDIVAAIRDLTRE